MTLRFQADADLNQKIVDGLLRRERAVDFQRARDAGIIGRPDRKFSPSPLVKTGCWFRTIGRRCLATLRVLFSSNRVQG
jgi:hypothetical protein